MTSLLRVSVGLAFVVACEGHAWNMKIISTLPSLHYENRTLSTHFQTK